MGHRWIIFYRHVALGNFHLGGDNCEILRVPYPAGWGGTDAEMLEIAQAKFKEKFGCSEQEYGRVYHRAPVRAAARGEAGC